MLENKKVSILLVLKVLEEYSDKEHYLTQKDIIKKIYSLYHIELERKSVAYSLSLLEELGYDIDKGSRGGFALLSRTFDETEASFIIDGLLSSRSINGEQVKKICEAVVSGFSKYQRKDYSYLYKSKDINRTSSKEVLYNVSIIYEAINKGKRIGFKYVSYDEKGDKVLRKDGYQYIVSPYYLINNYGRYYLLGNYREKYRPLQTFRIDYMIDIEIKDDWPIKRIEELKDLSSDFSITKYINEHIYLFNGEVVNAKIELDGEGAIISVKDWFGEDAIIENVNGKIIAVIRCDEEALCYWILQYSDCVKVLSPFSLVDKVKNILKNALRKYEE